MSKLKTRKSVAKRFCFTKTGKIKRRLAGKSHILTKKTRKRKRILRRGGFVGSANIRAVKQQLPYGK